VYVDGWSMIGGFVMVGVWLLMLHGDGRWWFVMVVVGSSLFTQT
jgi:hypothetical protein